MADVTPYPGTPRWVKVSAVVALVILLLVAVAFFTKGSHGPGRHTRGPMISTAAAAPL